MATNSTTKDCPRCLQRLPHAAFGKDAGRLYGLSAYCRECHNGRSRIQPWSQGTQKRSSEYGRRWRAAHPSYLRDWRAQRKAREERKER